MKKSNALCIYNNTALLGGSATRTCLSNGSWGNFLTSGCISQSSCNLQLLVNEPNQ